MQGAANFMYRGGAATPQMASCRRNPQGERVLRPVAALGLLDDT